MDILHIILSHGEGDLHVGADAVDVVTVDFLGIAAVQYAALATYLTIGKAMPFITHITLALLTC